MRTIFLGECLGLVLAFATGCGRAPESTVVFTNQIGRTVPELTMQAGQWHFGPVEVKKDSSVTAVFRESPGQTRPSLENPPQEPADFRIAKPQLHVAFRGHGLVPRIHSHQQQTL